MSRRVMVWWCVVFVMWSGCRRDAVLGKGSIVLEAVEGTVGAGRAKKGRVLAVLVGINTYKDKRFRALRYGEKDARDMKGYLESVGVKSGDIKLLVGEEATLVRVKAAVGKWLRQRAGRGDAVFVFVSTHGEKLEGGNFLVMYDSDAANLEYSGLSGGFLEDALKRMRVRQQMLVLDTCFSRAVASEYIASLGRKSNFLPNTHGTMFRGENRVVFTSSDGNEVSLEPRNLGNGLYTHYFLKGLRGEADKNGDKCITAQEIQDYVSDKVSDEARKLGATQTPSWRPDIAGKGMLLVRMSGCGQRDGGVPSEQGSTQKAGDRKTFMAEKVEFAMRWIPTGKFMRGSPSNESERDKDEGPQRSVQISKGFWMLETEVTQGQYKALMGSNPSHFKHCGNNCPVEQVNWHDARAFADKLSKAQGLAPCTDTDSGIFQCKGWRLPTEAEWEYAARAGSTGARHGELDDMAWYNRNSERKTHPVGEKSANGWGLKDMLGNVWEWTMDIYKKDSYAGLSTKDPFCRSGGLIRVLRGASWRSIGKYVRLANRNDVCDVSCLGDDLGFRLLRY